AALSALRQRQIDDLNALTVLQEQQVDVLQTQKKYAAGLDSAARALEQAQQSKQLQEQVWREVRLLDQRLTDTQERLILEENRLKQLHATIKQNQAEQLALERDQQTLKHTLDTELNYQKAHAADEGLTSSLALIKTQLQALSKANE